MDEQPTAPDVTGADQLNDMLATVRQLNSAKLTTLAELGVSPSPLLVLQLRIDALAATVFRTAPDLGRVFELRYENTVSQVLDNIAASRRAELDEQMAEGAREQLSLPPQAMEGLILPPGVSAERPVSSEVPALRVVPTPAGE